MMPSSTNDGARVGLGGNPAANSNSGGGKDRARIVGGRYGTGPHAKALETARAAGSLSRRRPHMTAARGCAIVTSFFSRRHLLSPSTHKAGLSSPCLEWIHLLSLPLFYTFPFVTTKFSNIIFKHIIDNSNDLQYILPTHCYSSHRALIIIIKMPQRCMFLPEISLNPFGVF